MSRSLHLAEPAARVESGLLPSASYTYPPIGADQYVEFGMSDDLTAHHQRFGDRPTATGRGAAVLLGILEETGLTGRGGGHFPVAQKWRSALRAGGGGIVVANAAESEPASAKDRALLAAAPHLILDGLSCAAEVLGATEAVIWLHEDAFDARRAVSTAIAERHAQPLAYSPQELAFRQVLAPPRYLSGESSAILRALGGGPALPSFSRHPAAVNGFRGAPAVVHNVETLARIGLLARTGARRHRPTTLVTVCTPAARTVLEVGPRTSVADAVRSGGWNGPDPQALLVGGYGGSWLRWSVAKDLSLEENSCRAIGASLGAGVLLPLGELECGIARTADIAAFMAEASARQCGPCRFGLPDLAKRLQALAKGSARRDEAARLEALGALIDGRGGCHHPDGVVRMVASALRTFAPDVDRHAHGRSCAAGTATKRELG